MPKITIFIESFLVDFFPFQLQNNITWSFSDLVLEINYFFHGRATPIILVCLAVYVFTSSCILYMMFERLPQNPLNTLNSSSNAYLSCHRAFRKTFKTSCHCFFKATALHRNAKPLTNLKPHPSFAKDTDSVKPNMMLEGLAEQLF